MELDFADPEQDPIVSKWILCLHSTGKNSAQTDEEKQRERQRNEREQKNAELEALHIKVNKCSSPLSPISIGQ